MSSAELSARATAAAAVLADYKRAAETADTADRALWGARLADMLALLLAALDYAEDSRKLAEIRAIFDTFDWETDDRQYALEQIDDIVNGEDE